MLLTGIESSVEAVVLVTLLGLSVLSLAVGRAHNK